MHHDLNLIIFGKTECLCDFLVMDVLLFSDLNLEIMIPGAKRANLVDASCNGFSGNGIRICPGNTPVGFYPLEVFFSSKAIINDLFCPLDHDLMHPIPANVNKSLPPNTCLDELEQSIDELFHLPLDLVIRERGHDRPHATVNVKPNTPRADDAFFLVECGNAAYRKAIPPVAIWHAKRIIDNTGKRCNICGLVKDTCIHCLQELLCCYDPAWDPHSFLVARWKLPSDFVNLPDTGWRPNTSFLHRERIS